MILNTLCEIQIMIRRMNAMQIQSIVKSHLIAFADFLFFIFHSVHTQPVVTTTSRIIDSPNSTPRTAISTPPALPADSSHLLLMSLMLVLPGRDVVVFVTGAVTLQVGDAVTCTVVIFVMVGHGRVVVVIITLVVVYPCVTVIVSVCVLTLGVAERGMLLEQ